MCAQPMLAAPTLPPMSSSAAHLGPRSQNYLRDPQYWDPFTSHTPGSVASSGSIPRQPAQETYDGYVARWIADAAMQTSRARSVSGSLQQAGANGSTSSSRYNDYKSLGGLDSSLDRLVLQPQSNWPPMERVHRSMSPEAASRKNSMVRSSSTDAATDQIASYLQIPSSINGSKGSLADLAAQITCLFWFEDTSTLNRVEDSHSSPSVSPLSHEATPTVGFRKWVTTLLSTTQVSQNVILMALLFIYRLKKITLNVQGKVGSEYRLLTVALMLGNKFLDDNTYTNKTWADVSGISVSEIHVMEVEFLSNMKYNLYTSAGQWDSWHTLLGKFSDYFERASRLGSVAPTPMCVSASTPHLNGQPMLPFTPPSEQLSPPLAASQRISNPQRQLPNPMSSFMVGNVPPVAHRLSEVEMRPTELRAAGSRPVSRKRSYDLTNFELPQKVARTSGLGQDITSTLSSSSTPESMFPRLPMPTNSMPGSVVNPQNYGAPYSTMVTPMTASQLTLPAPAMITPEPMWQQQGTPISQSMGPSIPSLPNPFTQTPQTLQPLSRADPQDVSPTNSTYNGTPQQTQSPSGYLMYRNSPYRPVRQVNTLLAPPPSVSLQNPMQHMSQQHTFYQPLSKQPIEPRQGMVPYLTPRQFQMAPIMENTRQIPPFEYRQLFK